MRMVDVVTSARCWAEALVWLAGVAAPPCWIDRLRRRLPRW